MKTMLRSATMLLVIATVPAAADEKIAPQRYEVVHLDTSGVSSRASSINGRGDAAGNTVRPDGQYRHATLWQDGRAVDLGALGGRDANSSVVWDGLNERGTVVGISQTARPEPLGENWSCSFFFSGAMPTGRTCLGFVWERGRMRPLSPFAGGNNSYATAVNARDLIVGWAENGFRDPSCTAPQILQFRAALWQVSRSVHRMVELAPLLGEQTSAATAINDRGDVVGISGACDMAVGRYSAKRSTLWRRGGPPTEIPNLGGTSWNTPTAINDRGQVVGFANKPGPADAAGEIDERAFYWSAEDGLEEIGTLPGDLTSEALGINRRGLTVGFSSGPAGNRAFIWRRGEPITDLNTLVANGYEGTLIDARDVNDAGEITGAALDATGKRVAFIARPLGRTAD